MCGFILFGGMCLVVQANPGMKINACSPGWIETDLTRPFAVAAGKTPKEMVLRFTFIFLKLQFGETPPSVHMKIDPVQQWVYVRECACSLLIYFDLF